MTDIEALKESVSDKLFFPRTFSRGDNILS